MFFMIISKSTLKYLPFQLKEILLELFPQVQEPPPRALSSCHTLFLQQICQQAFLYTSKKSPPWCHKQQPENLHEMR